MVSPNCGWTRLPRLALDRRGTSAVDVATARMRGVHRHSTVERGAPAVHGSAAARGGDRDAAALVGSGLEIAGILHAGVRPDAVPFVLPGGRGAGVSVRHRRAREPRPALADGRRISVFFKSALEGAQDRHAVGSLRLHALLEPGAVDRLL